MFLKHRQLSKNNNRRIIEFDIDEFQHTYIKSSYYHLIIISGNIFKKEIE